MENNEVIKKIIGDGGENKVESPKENPFFNEVKDKLNGIGKGMCLAKWTQVTLQLQSGFNHSCHHPSPHKIPEEEIKRNPSALHNTRHKKIFRKEMLEGIRPKECDYCWGIEDSSSQFSDRIFKSGESWSWPYRDEIISSNWRDDYNPKYVEVSFSNMCNFKCMYCGPAYSSKWMDEINHHGGYPTTDNFNSLSNLENSGRKIYSINEENPYVKAFWEWWPDLYRDLNIFRITGGEPLMAPDTWWILDHIITDKNPNRELSLAINSNLGVNDALINRLIEKVNKITEENRVKEFIIFTSVDTWGSHAEYIRTGMVFNRFWDNVNKILEKCPKISITFMSTYNALSILKYDKLITEIYKLKETYGSDKRPWNSATFLDTSYLRFPQNQTIRVLPQEFSKNILNQAKIMSYYYTPAFDYRKIGYSDVELQKVKRLYDWMVAPQNEKMLNVNRYDFYKYFSEHDKRRNTDFCKTFPEFEDFFNQCKNIKL